MIPLSRMYRSTTTCGMVWCTLWLGAMFVNGKCALPLIANNKSTWISHSRFGSAYYELAIVGSRVLVLVGSTVFFYKGQCDLNSWKMSICQVIESLCLNLIALYHISWCLMISHSVKCTIVLLDMGIAFSVIHPYFAMGIWPIFFNFVLGISALTISCRCAAAPEGVSPACHLGDGSTDLVLVSDASRLNYLRHLIRINAKTGRQVTTK